MGAVGGVSPHPAAAHRPALVARERVGGEKINENGPGERATRVRMPQPARDAPATSVRGACRVCVA
eukprot:1544326-Prymnesium_polylepis.1